MTNVLTVWWGGQIVGSLSVDRHGDTAFAYAEEWLSKPSPRTISIPYVKRRARELAEAANEAADRTVESFDLGNESAEIMKRFSTLVNTRASQLSEICR